MIASVIGIQYDCFSITEVKSFHFAPANITVRYAGRYSDPIDARKDLIQI